MATRPSWRTLFAVGALVAIPAVALTPTHVHTAAATRASSAVADAVSTAGLPAGYSIAISGNGTQVTLTTPAGPVNIDLSKVPGVGSITIAPDGTITILGKNGQPVITGSLTINAPAGEDIVLSMTIPELGSPISLSVQTTPQQLVTVIGDLVTSTLSAPAAHVGAAAPIVTFRRTTVRMTDGTFLYTYDNALCGQRYLYQNAILSNNAQVTTLSSQLAAIRPAATLNREVATLSAAIKKLSPTTQKAQIARDRAQIARDRAQLAALGNDQAQLTALRATLGHEWAGLARDNHVLKGDACRPADVNKNILSFNAHGDLHISVGLLNMMHAKLGFQKSS